MAAVPAGTVGSHSMERTGMNDTSYLIAVEIEATLPLADVVTQLQAAYDAGAAGWFEVTPTQTPGLLVLFLRSAVDTDADLLVQRMSLGTDVRIAACEQLAAELGAVDNATTCALAAELASGRARCIDFGSGVLARVGTATP